MAMHVAWHLRPRRADEALSYEAVIGSITLVVAHGMFGDYWNWWIEGHRAEVGQEPTLERAQSAAIRSFERGRSDSHSLG